MAPDQRTGPNSTPPDLAPPGAPGPRTTAVEIIWQNPWVRAVAYIALFVFIVMVLWRFREGYGFALQIALVGYVIAYILSPVVNALERIRIRRSVSVIFVYLLLLMILVLGSVLVSQVVAQMTVFIGQIPEAIERISETLGSLGVWFQRQFETLPAFLRDLLVSVGVEAGPDEQLADEIQQQIEGALQEGATALLGLLRSLAERGPALLVSGATTLVSTTLQVILILIASAYFLYDFPKFTANFRRFVPVRWRPLYTDLADKTDAAIGGYLRGQLLITTLLGILIWIGLSIIGVPLALAISFLAAIFNLVPYLGPIIGVVPAVLLGFTVSPLTGLLAIVVFVVANQVEGHLLSPIILSRSMNLHPVTVLLAIVAGLGLFGFVGALLAVPVVALVKVILESYLLTRPAYQIAWIPPLGDVSMSGPHAPRPAEPGEPAIDPQAMGGRERRASGRRNAEPPPDERDV